MNHLLTTHFFSNKTSEALLNCSFGRDWDEQHCWFAGFLLEPKVRHEKKTGGSGVEQYGFFKHDEGNFRL